METTGCITKNNLFLNNEAKSYTAKCEEGFTGSDVTIVVPINAVSSIVSVEDANDRALVKAQEDAEDRLSCTEIPPPPSGGSRFLNDTIISFTATAPVGYSATSVTKTLQVGEIASTISIQDANHNALLFVTHLAQAELYKNMMHTTPYIGLGFNSTVGKGSMTKNSFILTLQSSMGFKIGDYAVVETDKNRGSVGVGGSFPQTIYTTIAQMNGVVGQDGIDYAGNLEDGKIYRYDGITASWIPYSADGHDWPYYLEKILPYALENAKVVSVSSDGLSVTLDKQAKADTVNANVYYDHYELIQNLMNTIPNVVIPKGKFAVGRVLHAKSSVTITFKGVNRDDSFLFSPRGAMTLSLHMNGIWQDNRDNHAVVSDITLIGNKGFDGFRFEQAEDDGIFLVTVAGSAGKIENPYVYVQGIEMGSWHGTVNNVRVIDAMGYFVQQNVRDCKTLKGIFVDTTGDKSYIGWAIHAEGDQSAIPGFYPAYSTEVSDNIFVCPNFTRGWEMFKTQNCNFLRNKSFNGILSNNGTANCLLQDNSFYNVRTAKLFYPALNLGVSYIEGNGFMDASDQNMYVNNRIAQAKTYEGIQINGFYNRTDTNNIVINGFRVTSDDGDDNFSPVGLHFEADGCVGDDVHIDGRSGPDFYNYPNQYFDKASISVKGNSLVKNSSGSTLRATAGGSFQNCTGDIIFQ